jgi:hypothetical protein
MGYLQLHMLEFCRKHPGPHCIHSDCDTLRVARSLEKRGLLHITDCGMCTSTGKPCLMVTLAT